MNDIQIYSTRQCPYCVRAKALLQSKGLAYSETDITDDIELAEEMNDRSGNRTVPQIFINGEAIGGFDELSVLNKHGKL
ncbi:MAG: glutaredoxin 3 [Halobacteria archaeon]|nr:glutaredoxin 3 [Halobacteria archaeon]